MPVLNFVLHLYSSKIQTFGIFTAHWLWIMGNGKLIWYFRSPWCAIVSNMIHFFYLVCHERKNGFFWTMRFYLYWRKIRAFRIFMGNWLRINGNQFDILEALGKPLPQIWLILTIMLIFCFISKSIVPDKYPAREFQASRIFGWIFCCMVLGSQLTVMSVLNRVWLNSTLQVREPEWRRHPSVTVWNHPS